MAPPITAVRTHLLMHELRTPLRFAFGEKHERVTLFLELECQGGAIGWGEANWGGQLRGGRSLVQLIEERVAPALKGRDPEDRRAIWGAFDELKQDGNRVAALGAVDMALWDLAGQLQGQPIHRLLGGQARREVAFYASDLMMESADYLVARAKALVAEGFPGIKMRVGRDPAEDLRRVRAVREAIGPDCALFVDANGQYNLRQALQLGAGLYALGVQHFEEPLPKWDIEGYGQLARRLLVPIAGGECTAFAHMASLMRAGGAEVLQPDVTVNGITETEKVSTLAEAFGAEVILHNFEGALSLAGTLQVAAAMPGPIALQELDSSENPLRTELLTTALVPSKGRIPVPDGPGLGVQIDRAALDKYRVL